MLTAKQKVAMARNWKIRTLRAIYGLCYQLDEDIRIQAQSLIDIQLVRMGAKRGGDRYIKSKDKTKK